MRNFTFEKAPRDFKSYISKFFTTGHDKIAEFHVGMEWWMFYRITKFQNFIKYYKILPKMLQNYQHSETDLLLMLSEAFYFNVNNYIW